MIPFDFQLRTRIVFGEGQFSDWENWPANWVRDGAIVVSDPGVVATGHTQHGLELLQRPAFLVTCSATSSRIPHRTMWKRVTIGTPLRTGINCGLGWRQFHGLCQRHQLRLHQRRTDQGLLGSRQGIQPMLPMIAVPTTAGTGSEAQSFALISDAQTHVRWPVAIRRPRSASPSGPRADKNSAAAGHGIDRNRCHRPRPRNVRDDTTQLDFVVL